MWNSHLVIGFEEKARQKRAGFVKGEKKTSECWLLTNWMKWIRLNGMMKGARDKRAKYTRSNVNLSRENSNLWKCDVVRLKFNIVLDTITKSVFFSLSLSLDAIYSSLSLLLYLTFFFFGFNIFFPFCIYFISLNVHFGLGPFKKSNTNREIANCDFDANASAQSRTNE